MSFETPSDRFKARSQRLYATLKRFFLLRPLDSHKLLKTVWTLALVVYGLQLLAWLLTIPSYFGTKTYFPGFWAGVQLFMPLVFAPVGPLLWLLVIRLVLEVCARVLAGLPGAGEQDNPS
ncbi:MAG TPA: hypothetical protein VF744_01825 [Beijerinckiaceae bacterium]|jgi:hypothetical protein